MSALTTHKGLAAQLTGRTIRLFIAARIGAQKGALCDTKAMSALPPKADIRRYLLMLLCANSGLMQCSKLCRYSIISAARASSAGGKLRPSAFAVFRLIRSSNLVA